MHASRRQPQRAPDGAPLHYHERHRPEQTTRCRLVKQHAASFIAQTQASTGSELPSFIKDEFDAFLECGILAHGFLRLRCGEGVAAVLNNALQKCAALNLKLIVAVGHSDRREAGSDAARVALSLPRAEAAKAYLVAHGIRKDQIFTEGKGDKRPANSATDADAQAKNRRVEMDVLGSER